mmetsp:Transcript_11645/g.34975  ORF Transcript_11645/g.34975 Transcript_11645/m.34975 type:complete len:81 (+) Transcript_11645:2815-3057(+)
MHRGHISAVDSRNDYNMSSEELEREELHEVASTCVFARTSCSQGELRSQFPVVSPSVAVCMRALLELIKKCFRLGEAAQQ